MITSLQPLVTPLGRLTPNGVSLLGTAFSISPGIFVTAAHVTERNDENLVLVLSDANSWVNGYQDTSNNKVRTIPCKVKELDPFRDLCLLQVEGPLGQVINIQGTDVVSVGDRISILGYPHADYGRMVLTHHGTEIGAKILIAANNIPSKHVVLNVQSRPGQSGSPVFRVSDNALVAIVIGSYAPNGGSGIRLGNIDPGTLHQTTHAISSEYLKEML